MFYRSVNINNVHLTLVSPSSNINTATIFGVVVAGVVILLLAILATACFLYRRLPGRKTAQAVDNIENVAYDGNAEPGDDNQYEEPTAYAQLDGSKRIPLDQIYENLNVESYESPRDLNENAKRYASFNMHDTNHNVKPEDSVYEIIP